MTGAWMINRVQASVRLLLLLLCCLLASGRVLAVNLADVPLFISSGAEPNIMFVLDDSGSMRFGFMPDSLINNASAGNCANHGSYAGTYLCFFYANNGRQFLASSYLNKQYYDPVLNYAPPARGNGSNFPAADFTSAPLDGYDPDSATINLSVNYRAIMDDFYYSSHGGFTVSEDGNAEPAFYFNFLDAVSGCVADPYKDSCYSKVNVANQSAAQKQNFANWFSYYRTRNMASKAGIGNAFNDIKADVRVGYGRINKDGTVEKGVRDFQDEGNRDGFFSWLYGVDPSGGTPLRKSLDDVGQYYSQTDDAGPYSSTPGDSSGGVNYECRSSYTVLMTDGYWNGDDSPDVGNQDGNNGSPIQAPNGDEYTYTAQAPFSDGHSDTLADVAMKYWKTDLQPDMQNRVPTSNRNPAFWQHMVTYGVGLGVTGSVDPDQAFAAIDDDTIEIQWDDPSNSDPAKIDDLLHAAVNSRGGFFSAANPETFAKELSAVLNDIVDRGTASSASVVANSTRLDTDSLVYQARFNPDKWSGDVLAFALADNGDVKAQPKWSAASRLDAMALEDRRVLVGSGQSLAPLSAAHLDGDAELAAWLKGDRGQEQAQGGTLRDRDSRLGDIINSNPAFSGRQGFGYQRLRDEDQGPSYLAFRAAQRERTELVLVAANDGMVHAFNADSGEEMFAYIPGFLLDKLPQLADPDYRHQYFLDGSIVVIDAWLDSADDSDSDSRGWRTLAVGTAGVAGRGLYVLDITDPQSPQLVWELDGDDAGYLGEGVNELAVFPTLIPQKGNNPDKIKWVVAMGNGYNSADQRARLMLFDLQNPSSVESVAVGAAGANGLSGITAINATGGGVNANTVYAGDLNGDLWKFNQDASDGSWKVAIRAQGQDRPLFSGAPERPITARPDVTMVALEEGGEEVTMVFFGTGKYLETSDLENTNLQSLYGIVDSGRAVAQGDLLDQRILFEDSIDFAGKVRPVRLVSDNALEEGHKGWYLPLVYQGKLEGERSVVRPVLHSSSVLFTTMIPSNDPCAGGGRSWVMALDKATGGRLDEGVFDFDDDGKIDENDFIRYLNAGLIAPSGLGSDRLLTRPNVLIGPGGVDIVHTSDSSGDVSRFNIQGSGDLLGRHSWRQIR